MQRSSRTRANKMYSRHDIVLRFDSTFCATVAYYAQFPLGY